MESLPQDELEPIKKQLLERRSALLNEIRDELKRSDEQRYIDLAGRVHDSGDEAVADLLVDLDIAIVGQHIQETRDIEEALRRMKEGGYGFCETCGEKIVLARLQTQPTALRCLACQDRYERSYAQQGRPKL